MSDQKICPTCGTEYPLSERFCPRDGTALRSANAQADLLGSIVAERYHILKKLGEGGMGTVYLAEHVKMGRKSALKVMNPGMNTDPDAIARFNREASNASRLSHPNICGIYDFGETPDGLIYLAMEFIEGQALTALIEKSGALQPARAATIIHQTADALQIAHDAGIVHRDLKPDNIMIAKTRDGGDLVKVVDFGIAKASSSDAQKVTKTGLVVGTPEYMSPEQLAGDKLDGRSDTYSLALVAFNCLTGKLPFPAETVQESMIMRLTDRPRFLAEVRPDIEWPAELQATLDKALARDAAERYMSAAQFGREFAAAIASMPATMAAEAGTQVVGAQAMPKTKVTRPSGNATVAMNAEAAQPTKRPAAQPTKAQPAAVAAPAAKGMNPAVKFGGPAVAIFASMVAIWISTKDKKQEPPSGAQSPVPAESSTVAPRDPTAAGVASPPANGTKADSGTKTGMGPASAPGTKTPVPANPSAGGNRPSNTTTAPTQGKAVPGGETAPTNVQLLGAWTRELDRDDQAPTVGSRVLSELNIVFDRLTGQELANGWFVRMLAHWHLNEEAKMCEAAREVQRRSSDATKRTRAGIFLENLCTQ
ncbi:MAG: serine/threonine protein kinase [Gemmatimonadaceae bacterium]